MRATSLKLPIILTLASPFKSLKSSLKLPIVLTLICILIITLITPNGSLASAQINTTKTSTADFNQGTNTNTNTAGDEMKMIPNPKTAWYQTGGTWNYRKKIIIDHTKVPNTDQTDFPVLINLASDAELAAHARSDGYDILLTQDDATSKLSHEIESFDGTTGALVLWVKIPFLSHLSNTVLYMYYGNASAANQQTAAAVWSNGYAGVWHMGETGTGSTGDYKDSTAGAHNSTNTTNQPSLSSGKIGNSEDFNGSATNKVAIGSSAGLNSTTQATYSTWIYPKSYVGPGLSRIAGRGNAGLEIAYFGEPLKILTPALDWKDTGYNLSWNTWSKITMAFDGSVWRLFINDALKWTSDATTINLSGELYIGSNSGGNETFNGKIDETHVSSTVSRSADWIATEYANQNDPGTFYSVQPEVAKSAVNIASNNISTDWYTINSTEQTAWKYRRQITIDHTKVPNTDQSEFPMLVKITDATDPIFSKALSNGNDILFTNTSGNVKLAHEIETFNATAGSRALWAWVKIPVLKTASDTTIWLYYGNPSASSGQAPAAVWSNGYAGVWHLGEASGNRADSTSYGNVAAPSNASQAIGKIGNASELTGSTNSRLEVGDKNEYDVNYLSVSTWFKTDNLTPWQAIAARDDTTVSSNRLWDFMVYGGSNKLYAAVWNSSGTLVEPQGGTIDTGLHHAVLTYDGTNAKLYVDGSQVDSKALTGPLSTGTAPLNIGIQNRAGWESPFDGKIDEFEMANIARSADWIATEYANQNAPETFASISKESGYYPTAGTAGWYSTGGTWTNRQAVTIDHTKVPNTDQTDFPVLIKITNQSNGVFASAQADGDDILFTSSNGTTKLSHEIETYTTTAGSKALWAWVKVPTLSHTTDTVLYMYYGNASATNQQNKTDVWSNGYVGVWHFNESSWSHSSGDVEDSTSNGFNGTSYGGADTVAGKIGRSGAFGGGSYNGSYLDMGTHGGYNSANLTISAWGKVSTADSWKPLVFKYGASDYIDLSGYNAMSAYQRYNVSSGGSAVSVGTSTVEQLNTWAYETLALTGTNTWTAYTNGSSVGTVSKAAPDATSLWIARADVQYWPGGIDEVRIASVGRSADWISTEYANQNDPASFEQFSMESNNINYISPTSTGGGSGIIDTVWNGGWGNPTGFSSSVTVPSGTSINFQMRSSAVGGSTDSDWTAWADLGTATTGQTTFSVAAASMPPSITLGTNRYLQVRTLLSSDGTTTPTLSDYTVSYLADTTAPTNPSTTTATVGGSGVTTGTWVSSGTSPVFTFSGASDGGAGESGVAGYYIYYGTNASADPATYQAHVGAVGDNQTYTATGAVDGSHYYFRVKTKDVAGNISTAATLFDFGYDTTLPTRPTFVAADPAGYTTNNSFSFTWPAGGDANGAGGGASGIKWYEYKRATDGSWSHTADANTRTVSGITSYQEGANAFYVRTVDNAGNISSNYQQVTYYYSGVAPAKPTSLVVSPDTSDTNLFTISWNKPTVGAGDPPVKGYYYTINEVPTMTNLTYKASTADTTTIGPDAYATAQGLNTIYVLSVNDAGNYSLEDAFIASKTFTCQTSALPAPIQASIVDSSDRTLDRWMLTLQWAPGANQGSSFDHYVIYRSTDGLGFTELATTSSTAYIDASGLNNSTTYYYNIKAVDNAGSQSAQSTTVSKMPTGKYLTPPTYLNTPDVSNVKSSSGDIAWLTDRSSTSIVKYGKSRTDMGASSGQMDLATTHAVSLMGLDPSATYYFQVQSLDENRDYEPSAAYSTTYSFQTLQAPAISKVEVTNITLTSADISWETTTVSNSALQYGKNSSFDKTVQDISGAQATRHSVKLSDLTNSTKYAFKITATDVDGNALTSDNYNFETLPMPAVENLKATLLTDKARAGVKITWTTNVDTSSIIKYLAARSLGEGGSIDGQQEKESVTSKLTKEHEIIIENLSDQSNYKISASGRDSLGNLADATSTTIKTPNDTRPPAISNISIETSNVGLNTQDKAQAVISWSTDEPGTSRVEYGLGLSGDNYEKMTSEDSNLTDQHVTIISDLDPITPYHLRVTSKDAAGNLATSDSQVVISAEVQKSTLRLLLDALQKAFSWIKI